MNNSQKLQLKMYGYEDIDKIPQLQKLTVQQRVDMKAVATVLPFRVNNYVISELIDWDNVPEDPIFQLTFPQGEMLEPADLQKMRNILALNDVQAARAAASEIQLRLNPHPAGQLQLNRPKLEGGMLEGIQHKYRETVLFFPAPGQTCFAYCTYCFRWPQFIGIDELKLASQEVTGLINYLSKHSEVENVLITGGDPLIMRAQLLRKYIEPLLQLDHITSIRIGTKTPAYWPYRFLTDTDSDELLQLFAEVKQAGKHLALMSHYSHPRFLQTNASLRAIEKIQATGAIIRCQSPLVKHINDKAEIWSEMWKTEVRLGMVPYYMFVERDTGAKRYFEVPLWRCLEIFQAAYSTLSGLGRTVRGPSMSCTPGKVLIDGITEINGEKMFVLKFLQARDPAWTKQIFFAKYDETACWFDQLKPAFDSEFFFQSQLQSMIENNSTQAWLDASTPDQIKREPVHA